MPSPKIKIAYLIRDFFSPEFADEVCDISSMDFFLANEAWQRKETGKARFSGGAFAGAFASAFAGASPLCSRDAIYNGIPLLTFIGNKTSHCRVMLTIVIKGMPELRMVVTNV